MPKFTGSYSDRKEAQNKWEEKQREKRGKVGLLYACAIFDSYACYDPKLIVEQTCKGIENEK